LVRYRCVDYSIPTAYAHRDVLVRGYVHEVVISCGGANVCGRPKNDPQTDDTTRLPLMRWSVQEIRRIAIRLARRRIQPAHIIAWSLWRRAHQAEAQRAHLKVKMQL
ncbi:MAG TPA: hypothetical protein VKA94_01450, partial [Hyphomicrobiales bacterium]|nr:hypothetical protein [Hyphomicrobiales bacterium]